LINSNLLNKCINRYCEERWNFSFGWWKYLFLY